MKHTPRARERTEEFERASLSTWATLAVETKGRDREEGPDHLRTAFQQDCERILSSAAFRRLRGKTQSLLRPEGDGPRIRLTHTLGVSHTARTIARALRLNEDLAEAIALGHELGATAFAGAGEEALSAFGPQPFRHNEQGLRVAERLEGGGTGLNLTWEVRDGILGHTPYAPVPATIEGQIVRITSRIVTLTDELGDALRMGICLPEDLPSEVLRVLGGTPPLRLAALVRDVVGESADAPEASTSTPAGRMLDSLEAFLDERVQARGDQLGERARAIHCLRSLVVFYLDNPDRLPAIYRSDGPSLIHTLDFVSSLTDAQALSLFHRLFLPTAATR
ncbi:MAG: HD domain-containing protein [Egibacteraceae bacterium]